MRRLVFCSTDPPQFIHNIPLCVWIHGNVHPFEIINYKSASDTFRISGAYFSEGTCETDRNSQHAACYTGLIFMELTLLSSYSNDVVFSSC